MEQCTCIVYDRDDNEKYCNECGNKVKDYTLCPKAISISGYSSTITKVNKITGEKTVHSTGQKLF